MLVSLSNKLLKRIQFRQIKSFNHNSLNFDWITLNLTYPPKSTVTKSGAQDA